MSEQVRKERWSLGHWIAVAFVCYLIPFAVVLVDELAGTHYFWTGSNPVFEALYGPLIDLVNYLGLA
jgi:hypothetical protein